MTTEKKIGYLLLAFGLALLAATPVLLCGMIYGSLPPPQAFLSDSLVTVTMPTGMTLNVPMPPHVNRMGNLSLGVLLMFFIAFVGGKIAGLGVQLITRPPAPKSPVPPQV